jgi:hypothetical protein
MKVEAQAPDVEHLVKEYLQDVMAEVDCTISIGVPGRLDQGVHPAPRGRLRWGATSFVADLRARNDPARRPCRLHFGSEGTSALAARAGSSLTTATAKSSAPDS